jgi:hypothetical protein
LAGGLVQARRKTHVTELPPKPCRRVMAGAVKSRIGADTRESQQFEEACDTIVQGTVNALQNIVKTFHLQNLKSPVRNPMQSLMRHNPSARPQE